MYVCFGSLPCWKTYPQPILSLLAETRRLSPVISWYKGPFIFPLMWWSWPVILAEKHPQSIMFLPLCLMVGMVLLGSIPLPPNIAIQLDSKKLNFGLIWLHHLLPIILWIIQVFIGKHVWTCAVLNRGPYGHCRTLLHHVIVCYQWFSLWLWSQLPWDH